MLRCVFFSNGGLARQPLDSLEDSAALLVQRGLLSSLYSSAVSELVAELSSPSLRQNKDTVGVVMAPLLEVVSILSLLGKNQALVFALEQKSDEVVQATAELLTLVRPETCDMKIAAVLRVVFDLPFPWSAASEEPSVVALASPAAFPCVSSFPLSLNHTSKFHSMMGQQPVALMAGELVDDGNGTQSQGSLWIPGGCLIGTWDDSAAQWWLEGDDGIPTTGFDALGEERRGRGQGEGEGDLRDFDDMLSGTSSVSGNGDGNGQEWSKSQGAAAGVAGECLASTSPMETTTTAPAAREEVSGKSTTSMAPSTTFTARDTTTVTVESGMTGLEPSPARPALESSGGPAGGQTKSDSSTQQQPSHVLLKAALYLVLWTGPPFPKFFFETLAHLFESPASARSTLTAVQQSQVASACQAHLSFSTAVEGGGERNKNQRVSVAFQELWEDEEGPPPTAASSWGGDDNEQESICASLLLASLNGTQPL